MQPKHHFGRKNLTRGPSSLFTRNEIQVLTSTSPVKYTPCEDMPRLAQEITSLESSLDQVLTSLYYCEVKNAMLTFEKKLFKICAFPNRKNQSKNFFGKTVNLTTLFLN